MGSSILLGRITISGSRVVVQHRCQTTILRIVINYLLIKFHLLNLVMGQVLSMMFVSAGNQWAIWTFRMSCKYQQWVQKQRRDKNERIISICSFSMFYQCNLFCFGICSDWIVYWIWSILCDETVWNYVKPKQR